MKVCFFAFNAAFDIGIDVTVLVKLAVGLNVNVGSEVDAGIALRSETDFAIESGYHADVIFNLKSRLSFGIASLSLFENLKITKFSNSQLVLLSKNIVKYLAIFLKVRVSSNDVRTLYNSFCNNKSVSSYQFYYDMYSDFALSLIYKNNLHIDEKFVFNICSKSFITAVSVTFSLSLNIDILVKKALNFCLGAKEDASFSIDLGSSAEIDFDVEVKLRTEISTKMSEKIAHYLKFSPEFNNAVSSQSKDDVLLIICEAIRESLGNDAADAFTDALAR